MSAKNQLSPPAWYGINVGIVLASIFAARIVGVTWPTLALYAASLVVYQIIYWGGLVACTKLSKTFLKQDDAQKRTRWMCFALSAVNAIFCTAYSIFCWISTGSFLIYIPYYHEATSAILCGYFVHDILLSKYYTTFVGAEALHHSLAMLLLSAFFIMDVYKQYLTAIIFVEISTIFYDITWFCLKCGRSKSFICTISKYCFAIFFFLSRIVWFPTVVYAMATDEKAFSTYGNVGGCFIPIVMGVVYCLQWFWFSKIVKQVLGELGIAFVKNVQDKME